MRGFCLRLYSHTVLYIMAIWTWIASTVGHQTICMPAPHKNTHTYMNYYRQQPRPRPRPWPRHTRIYMCTAPSTYPVHRPTRVERLSIQCTVTYESACMMSVLSFSSHSRKSYNIQPVRARRRRPVHGRSIHQSRDRASCAPWPAGPSSPARRRTDIDACMDRQALVFRTMHAATPLEEKERATHADRDQQARARLVWQGYLQDSTVGLPPPFFSSSLHCLSWGRRPGLPTSSICRQREVDMYRVNWIGMLHYMHACMCMCMVAVRTYACSERVYARHDTTKVVDTSHPT